MRLFSLWILLSISIGVPSITRASAMDLMRDLMTVREIDKHSSVRMPLVYNQLSEGGYVVLPSARVGDDGSVTATYASIPPYTIYGARLQYFDRLEIVGNYRIFNGMRDDVLSDFGFGDFSDKGANIKFVLFRPEDTNYQLPGVAVGAQDFLGTKQFSGQYIVATKVWLDYDLELSLGFGFGRIAGLFGGVAWMPFRTTEHIFLKGLTFVAELDPTNYKSPHKERHPDGRVKKLPINYGIHYRLWDTLECSLAHTRGAVVSFSAGLSFPLGTTDGVFMKSGEDPVYRRPINNQKIGILRPGEAMMHELLLAVKDQHFNVLDAWMTTGESGRRLLWVRLVNERYRREVDVRDRLLEAAVALTPSNIEEVRFVVESGSLPVHEYRFREDMMHRYREGSIGFYELAVLSETTHPTRAPKGGIHLYEKSHSFFNWGISPRFKSFFGSSTGKYKYSLGLEFFMDGYLWGDIYYQTILGKNFVSDLEDVKDTDMLNRSPIINVRSDSVAYQKNQGIIFERMFLEKSWHLKNGFYSRLSGGWFEIAYGGVAAEFLYYPFGSNWAVGIEGAYLAKRHYSGLGFTDKVRKLNSTYDKTFETFHPHQAFLNVMYDLKEVKSRVKVSMGRFLAKYVGARIEVTRVFDSGFELTLWNTITTGHDTVNGDRYHDKGFAVSIPLDILYEHTSRDRWKYGLSAWLRDVGASASTGRPLYSMIHSERN